MKAYTLFCVLIVGVPCLCRVQALAAQKEEQERHNVPPAISISAIDVEGGDRKFSALAKTIREELYTELAGISGINLLARHELRPILDENILPTSSNALDDAGRLEKIRSAQFILAGTLSAQGNAPTLTLKLQRPGNPVPVQQESFHVGFETPFVNAGGIAEWIHKHVRPHRPLTHRGGLSQDRTYAVAVVPFMPLGSLRRRTELGDLLAGIAAVELGNLACVGIVERDRLEELWKEISLRFSGRTGDEATSLALQKADLLLYGSYWLQGRLLRVNLRLVQRSTGLVIARSKSDGEIQNIARMVRDGTYKLFGPGPRKQPLARGIINRTELEKESEAYLRSAFERSILSERFPERTELEDVEAAFFLKPTCAEILWYLGKRSIETGDIEGQVWAFRNFADRFPKDKRASSSLLMLARAHGNTKRWHRQEEILAELIKRYPKSPEGQDATEIVADLARSRGRLDIAAKFYDMASSANCPPEAKKRRLIKLARSAVELLDFAKATAVFETLFSDFREAPETHAVLPELIRVAIRAGRLGIAEKTLEKALAVERARRPELIAETLRELLEEGPGGNKERRWVKKLVEIEEPDSGSWRSDVAKRCEYILQRLIPPVAVGEYGSRVNPIADAFHSLERTVRISDRKKWENSYGKICHQLEELGGNSVEIAGRWDGQLRGLLKANRADCAQQILRDQGSLWKQTSDIPSIYTAQINASIGRHEEAIATYLSMWRSPDLKLSEEHIQQVISSFETLGDLSSARKFYVGLEEVSGPFRSSHAGLSLGRAYERVGQHEKAIDTYWRVYEKSVPVQRESRLLALDSISRLAMRSLFYGDAVRALHAEAEELLVSAIYDPIAALQAEVVACGLHARRLQQAEEAAENARKAIKLFSKIEEVTGTEEGRRYLKILKIHTKSVRAKRPRPLTSVRSSQFDYAATPRNPELPEKISHLNLTVFTSKDAVLVGGFDYQQYKSRIRAIVRRDGFPVVNYPVYFSFPSEGSTGVEHIPRLRERLVYTDIDGIADTTLRSGDLEELLEVAVKAGPEKRTIRVNVLGLTGSIAMQPDYFMSERTSAHVSMRVRRFLREMPGSKTNEDLLLLEVAAHHKKTLLPSFQLVFQLDAGADAQEGKKFRFETDLDGLASIVMRIPSGKPCVISVFEESSRKLKSQARLASDNSKFESPIFAQASKLPVRPGADITDYDEAGINAYLSGDYSEAANKWELSIKRQGKGVFKELLLFLALKRDGKSRQAEKRLREFADEIEPDRWMAPIALHAIGRITEDEVLEKARAKDEVVTTNRLCEAYFFLGSLRLIEGNERKAKAYFKKSVATGVTTYYEYQLANGELERLSGRLTREPAR